MSLATALSLAFDAARKNLLRTALALAGLVIGVAAVITMVALGKGAQDRVAEEVGSAGTNRIFVRAGNYVRGGDAYRIPSGLGRATTLTVEDAEALAAVSGVSGLTPVIEDRAPVSSDEGSSFAPVIGCGAALPVVDGLEIDRGAFFGESEVAAGKRVAVLGGPLAETLFPRGIEAGRSEIRIRGEAFTVVGASEAGEERVYVPHTSLSALLRIQHLHGVTASTETAGEATRVAEEFRRLLRERHGLDDPERLDSLPQASGVFAMRGTGIVPDDFTIRTEAAAALTQGLYTPAAALVLASMPRLDQVTSEEMVSTLARSNQTMTLLLASLAAVSLVVGGIGIMNVMLLSVTERTMEVGLRISVGARTRDVLLQFLFEAVTLSVAGGLLGIALGFASSFTVTGLLEWPTRISASALALAFALALGVGVIFGYYPAYRASRLDPIDALRYE